MLAKLGPSEKAALLRELLVCPKSPLQTRQIAVGKLLEAERWHWQRIIKAAPVYKHARIRYWLIFMLLRHGGLRLKEVLTLTADSCFFNQGYIHLASRIVPFNSRIARQLVSVWDTWPGKLAAFPLACETSQIRRNLAECAHACGLESARLNASALRRERGLELEAQGLHPLLAAYFLGKGELSGAFSAQSAMAIIQDHINREKEMKTSARNVFYGQVTKLEKKGILVSVTLETSQGVAVNAIITDASAQSLGLTQGLPVNALVKAPWVSVLPENERALAATENCYQGIVEKISSDGLACEINIAISSGDKLCALYANGASPSDAIQEGTKIIACFSPFSVILTRN